jgi:HK97 family phage major capsid protein
VKSRYNVLLQEKADLIAEAQAIFEEAAAHESEEDGQPVKGRDLTDAEKKRDDEIQAGLEATTDELARLTRQREREVGTEAVKEVIDNAPVAKALPTPFSQESRPWQRGFGEQLAAIARAYSNPSAGPDNRLMEIMAATGMSEGVGSEGGFLVQTDFTAELMREVYETGVLASRTDRTPIGANSNGLKVNAIDETSRADGSRQGGIQAYWAAEAGTLTKSKPTFRHMELTLQKLIGLYYATDELLMDTVALGAEITSLFSEEFGFKVDDAIYRGGGAGLPLGVLGHAGTVSVAKEAGQPNTTIVKENIENMYARIRARSLVRAEWFINQDCWPQLFQLSQVVGVGGVPVFINANMSNAPFGTLLGRPINPIEQCATLGTVGDIMFADFNAYKMIEKGGIEAASSIHVQFLTDEMTFRFTLRTDGQPKRNAPLTPFKGTKTQSSFITLASRP